MEDGAVIFLRRHGNPDGPRLVMSHGNGLAIDLYYPFWSLLSDRFDLIIHDLRSHGWNPVSSPRRHNPSQFMRDSWAIGNAIQDHFGEKQMVGVFHSLSTLPALCHLALDPRFEAIVLLDPPFCPPGGDASDLQAVLEPAADYIRRRRPHYETREEFVRQIDRSPVFSLIPPEARNLFGQTLLRRAPDGGYEFCCPPQHEAQIFEYWFGWAMRAQAFLDILDCPAKAISGDPTARHAYMPSLDLSSLMKLDYDFIPDTTHFLMLEAPERCAELTIEFLEGHGLA